MQHSPIFDFRGGQSGVRRTTKLPRLPSRSSAGTNDRVKLCELHQKECRTLIKRARSLLDTVRCLAFDATYASLDQFMDSMYSLNREITDLIYEEEAGRKGSMDPIKLFARKNRIASLGIEVNYAEETLSSLIKETYNQKRRQIRSRSDEGLGIIEKDNEEIEQECTKSDVDDGEASLFDENEFKKNDVDVDDDSDFDSDTDTDKDTVINTDDPSQPLLPSQTSSLQPPLLPLTTLSSTTLPSTTGAFTTHRPPSSLFISILAHPDTVLIVFALTLIVSFTLLILATILQRREVALPPPPLASPSISSTHSPLAKLPSSTALFTFSQAFTTLLGTYALSAPLSFPFSPLLATSTICTLLTIFLSASTSSSSLSASSSQSLEGVCLILAWLGTALQLIATLQIGRKGVVEMTGMKHRVVRLMCENLGLGRMVLEGERMVGQLRMLVGRR